MVSNALVLCAIIGFVAWYYYQKFQESEKEYYKLHSQFLEVCNENVRLKEKMTDLEVYKDDVSKTFKILDNELSLINNHIKTRTDTTPPTNRVSLLTPEMLSSLFTNVNQENPDVLASFSYELHAPIVPQTEQPVIQTETEEPDTEQPQQLELEQPTNSYEKFLINTE
jgi:predicted nuclease with TOPRIM domain